MSTSACPRTFCVGEEVIVVKYGKATVVEDRVTDPTSKFLGRYKVQYQDNGSTYYARPEALYKNRLKGQRVVVAKTTTLYKEAAVEAVNFGDTVIEVGFDDCASGPQLQVDSGRRCIQGDINFFALMQS
eukprot:gene10066-7962_t